MEYDEWGRRHRVANVLLQGRACELDRLYEEMEQDLEVGWGQGWGGTTCPASHWPHRGQEYGVRLFGVEGEESNPTPILWVGGQVEIPLGVVL